MKLKKSNFRCNGGKKMLFGGLHRANFYVKIACVEEQNPVDFSEFWQKTRQVVAALIPIQQGLKNDY